MVIFSEFWSNFWRLGGEFLNVGDLTGRLTAPPLQLLNIAETQQLTVEISVSKRKIDSDRLADSDG